MKDYYQRSMKALQFALNERTYPGMLHPLGANARRFLRQNSGPDNRNRSGKLFKSIRWYFSFLELPGMRSQAGAWELAASAEDHPVVPARSSIV